MHNIIIKNNLFIIYTIHIFIKDVINYEDLIRINAIHITIGGWGGR